MSRASVLLSVLVVSGVAIATGCKSKTGGLGIQNNTPPPGTPLAQGLGSPTVLAIDSSAIYFTDAPNGLVVKVTIANAVSAFPTVLTLAAGLANPFDIALDDTNVYCCERVPLGRIIQVPKSGGAYQVAAVATQTPSLLVSDASHLYWFDTDGSVTSNVVAATKTVPATVSVLASGVLAQSLLPDNGSLLVYEAPDVITGASTGKLTRIDPTTGIAVDIATGLDDAALNLTSDAQSFFWIPNFFPVGPPGNEYTVASLGRSPGAVESLLLPLPGQLSGSFIPSLAVDGVSAYFIVNSFGNFGPNPFGLTSGKIQKVPVQGGAVVTLSSFSGNATSLVVDSVNVYWGDPSTGTIWFLPK